jgi:hypothetical protein
MATAAQHLGSPEAARGEQVFLDELGVLVTSSRFVSPPFIAAKTSALVERVRAQQSQTYAMSNISSVGAKVPEKEMQAASSCLLVGAGLLYFGSGELAAAGAAALIGGIIVAIWAGSRRAVVIHTAGAQIHVIAGKRQFIERIVAAVNQAIVARG